MAVMCMLRKTTSGVKVFASRLDYNNGAPCGDVAINKENYRFVTHHWTDGKLEVRKPGNSLLHSIRGLYFPLGVCMDQSGAILIADRGTKKVFKH